MHSFGIIDIPNFMEHVIEKNNCYLDFHKGILHKRTILSLQLCNRKKLENKCSNIKGTKISKRFPVQLKILFQFSLIFSWYEPANDNENLFILNYLKLVCSRPNIRIKTKWQKKEIIFKIIIICRMSKKLSCYTSSVLL